MNDVPINPDRVGKSASERMPDLKKFRGTREQRAKAELERARTELPAQKLETKGDAVPAPVSKDAGEAYLRVKVSKPMTRKIRIALAHGDESMAQFIRRAIRDLALRERMIDEADWPAEQR